MRLPALGARRDMRSAWAWCLFLIVGIMPAAADVVPDPSKACLGIATATLRQHQIEEALLACTSVVNNAASGEESQAAALIQRGVLYGRRWALSDARRDAESAIADISAGLRRYRFEKAKRIQALLIRGQLYAATGRSANAIDDFREVLSVAPSDDVAKTALERLNAQR